MSDGGHDPNESSDTRPSRTLHDALFKRVFGDADNAAAELRAVLPAEVARHVDWATLALARANVVSERFVQRYGDLIFSARLTDGRDAFVWLLFEHQSTVDRWMALRIADLTLDLWKRWLERTPNARRLPAVIPVVLYHGARPWSAATSLIELMDLSPAAAADLRDHVLSCRYALDDLRATPDEALADRDLPPYPKLGLVVFKHGRDPDLPEHLARFGTELRALLATDAGTVSLGVILEYTWYVNDHVDRDVLTRHLEPVAGPEVERAIMTYAERLKLEGRLEGQLEGKREGKLEGKREGMLEGKREGIEIGQRQMLQRLLELRFGQLPEAVLARLDAAGLADFQRWFDRALDAGTLDEILDT